MLTLKEAQHLHRLHMKCIDAEVLWLDSCGDRGSYPDHKKIVLDRQKINEKWMAALTRLTEPT